MASDPLAQLGAQPDRFARLIVRETADLDRRLHRAHWNADVGFLALPLDVGRRPDCETAFRKEPDPEAVVGRSERKRVGAASDVDIPERPEFELVGTDELRLDLAP